MGCVGEIGRENMGNHFHLVTQTPRGKSATLDPWAVRAIFQHCLRVSIASSDPIRLGFVIAVWREKPNPPRFLHLGRGCGLGRGVGVTLGAGVADGVGVGV